MNDNLKKFANEAAYSAATLSYPAVSWVVSGDTVHYDKEAPKVYDKIMIAQHLNESNPDYFFVYNAGSSSIESQLSAITINGVDYDMDDSEYLVPSGNATYVATYTLDPNLPREINDWFEGDLGFPSGDDASPLEAFVPDSITAINNFPANLEILVINSTTPPLFDDRFSGHYIYVPDSAVNTYESAYDGLYRDNIYAMSDYSGYLPI